MVVSKVLLPLPEATVVLPDKNNCFYGQRKRVLPAPEITYLSVIFACFILYICFPAFPGITPLTNVNAAGKI